MRKPPELLNKAFDTLSRGMDNILEKVRSRLDFVFGEGDLNDLDWYEAYRMAFYGVYPQEGECLLDVEERRSLIEAAKNDERFNKHPKYQVFISELERQFNDQHPPLHSARRHFPR